ALIEGVMMRGPKKLSIAVRKPDNEIELEIKELNTLAMKNKFFGLPFIRGVVGLIESMIIGFRSLMFSAEFFEDVEDPAQEDSPSWMEKIFKDRAEGVEMFLTILASLGLSVLIFMLLPSFLTNFFKSKVNSSITLNLIEGLFRVTIFLIYIIWVSKLEDIKRVFEYHGAEH